jgi:nucleoside-diphosphate-sugar epimerase
VTEALVTGASGLLGRHVVRRLAREGTAVRALVRSAAGGAVAEAAGAREVVVGDLRDDALVGRVAAGVDTVIHCAGHVRAQGTRQIFEEVNVGCTRRLLAASEAAAVEVFVHVSSVGIYALPRPGETITEDTPLDAQSDRRGGYTHSKALADALVAGWRPKRPMRIVVVRPGHIYGAERPMFGRFARPVRGRHFVVLGDRDARLGFTWVENCADALVRAAARARPGTSRYIAVDDPTLTQQRFLDAVERHAPGRYRFTILPVNKLAPLLRRLPLPRQAGEQVYRLLRACCSVPFDTTRIRAEVGWSPPVSLEDTVARMLDAADGSAAPALGHAPSVAPNAGSGVPAQSAGSGR